MNKRLLLIGVSVVAVAVVGVWWRRGDGVIQNTQTSVMATSTIQAPVMLTYQNKSFGFAIEYPEKVVVKENGDPRFVDIIMDHAVTTPEDERLTVDQKKSWIVGITILIDNPITPDEYSSPCDWYYRERENDDVSSDPTICAGKTEQKYYAGYPTTFAGEPAYVRVKDSDGIDGGLYASKQYIIVFFHRGRPWEIQYSAPPDNPTDAWKHHPYYQYLAKSVPITDAIIKSFRFTQ